jgi:hypothetical protein
MVAREKKWLQCAITSIYYIYHTTMQAFLASAVSKKQKVSEEPWKKYVIILKSSSSNWLMRCTLCEHEFSGRSFRAKCHLAGEAGNGVAVCTRATLQIQTEIKTTLANSAKASSDTGKLANIKGGVQKGIDSFVRKNKFAEADLLLAKFVCTSGVSFHAMQNPHFMEFCNLLAPEYVPPSEYRLKQPLLDTLNDEVEQWKTSMINDEYITLTGDGWTNINGVGCSNMEAVTSFGPVQTCECVLQHQIDAKNLSQTTICSI